MYKVYYSFLCYNRNCNLWDIVKGDKKGMFSKMKMLKGKNRYVSMALAAALFAGLVGAVNVSNKNSKADNVEEPNCTYEELLPTMEQVAIEYAEEFAQSSLNVDVDSDVVTPIYNATDNIVGYSVSVKKDNKDYGYVSIDYTSDGLVTDFALQEDTESIYESLKEDFVQKSDIIEESECTNKLVSMVGADYAVSAVDNGKEVFYYNAKTYEGKDLDDMLNHYADNYLEYYDNTEYEDDFFEGNVAPDDEI